jgi:hypothetical protein
MTILISAPTHSDEPIVVFKAPEEPETGPVVVLAVDSLALPL